MGRLLASLLIFGLLPVSGQLREREQKPIELPRSMEDEDEDRLADPEYAFNPVLAEKELKVGNFYAKKGNHKAAVGRYREATKWNRNYAEAYWKLGRSNEKLEQYEDALSAYRRYLKLEPDGKNAKQARRRMDRLEKKAEKAAAAETR